MSYQTGKLLGSGTFGDVYEATHVKTGEKIAMKVEPLGTGRSTLTHEAGMLARLGGRRDGRDGVPSIRHPLKELHGVRVLGLDLFSHDLEKIQGMLPDLGAYISPHDCLKIADQLLKCLAFIHSKGIIHRDLKPDNIVLAGSGRRGTDVVVIDFGLAIPYLDSNGRHIKQPKGNANNLVGTARYASPNAHHGVCSRRDDIISLGHTLIYLLKGSLPWQGLRCPETATRKDKYKRLLDKKLSTRLKELCGSEGGWQFDPRLELFLVEFMSHAYELDFEDAPDFAYLSRLLRLGARECGYEDIASSVGFEFSEDLRHAHILAGLPQARTTYSNTPQGAYGGESWESSTVSSALDDLSNCNGGAGGSVPLQELNDKLEKMHIEAGISMKEMKDIIQKKGYCLKDCHAYGPELRQALRRNKSLLVPKEKAKRYNYVKRCMITV